MTVVALGSLSVGAAVPALGIAVEAGTAGIGAALPNIADQLVALSGFLPTDVDFAAQLALAQSITASIGAASALGLPVPTIGAQIAAVSALVAALLAKVELANAQLLTLANLNVFAAAAGVDAYAYDGAASSLGAELGAVVTGGGAHVNAIVLVTSSPATWSAMGAVLKVSP